MKTIVYPGTFDPITNGHIDLIERASKLFDKLIIGIASSQKKSPLFDIDERIALATESLQHLPNVEIKGFDYLLVNFVKDCGGVAVMRGLRAVSDFEYEFQLAGMNKKLNKNIETIFLMSDIENQIISSKFVKEIAKLKGNISKFVTKSVIKSVREKI